MRRYLVASLKLTPANPTFTEARDAVLLAALSSDRADYDLFVDAFAKRGMGSGAASPDRADANHKGVVESFQTGADLTIVPETLALDQTQTFCDSDGVLDNGEQGSLRFKVFNAGNKDAQNGVVTVAVASDSPVLVNGGKTATVKLPTMGPLSEKVIRVPVSLAGAQGVVPVRMDLEVSACHEAAAYVIEGEGLFGAEGGTRAKAGELVVFAEGGGEVAIASAGAAPLAVMLLGGRPAEGPLVFHGPFVMNSVEQARAADIAYRTGRMGTLPAAR